MYAHCKCVHLTLSRTRGFSGVSGHPILSLSASSNISVTYRVTERKRDGYKGTDEGQEWICTFVGDFKCYLCVAQVFHLLCDLGCIRCEDVLVVSQHHILDEELTHRL